jgi:hypothetical protein
MADQLVLASRVGNPTPRRALKLHPSTLQGRQMDIITEFRKHADECRRMARATRDFETKVIWNRMAERWQSLLATEETRARQRTEARPRRRQAHGWEDESRAA